MSQPLNIATTKPVYGSNGMMSFSEFYSSVREHFSKNPTSYEEFKNAATGRSKVEFLLEHPIVQEALTNLQTKNKITQLNIAKREKNAHKCIDASNNNEMKHVDNKRKSDVQLTRKHSRKYPQMSSKIDVKCSPKKGRYLVAKERINPGK